MTAKERIQLLPLGYSTVWYNGKQYGVTRKDFNAGKSIKVYAEERGGRDYISLNFYSTHISESIKPCEIKMEKIIHFLSNFKILNEN